jgi:hypothetical protein
MTEQPTTFVLPVILFLLLCVGYGKTIGFAGTDSPIVFVPFVFIQTIALLFGIGAGYACWVFWTAIMLAMFIFHLLRPLLSGQAPRIKPVFVC